MNNKTVDISKAVPYYQWEEAYKNAGLSGNAIYEKDGGISYKVDAGIDDFELIAATNEQRFLGTHSALTKSFPTLTAKDLLADSQTIAEVFVRVNPNTETVIAYMRIDNPLMLDTSPVYAYIDLDVEQIKDAINVARNAAQEFTAAVRKDIDVKGLVNETRDGVEMNAHYFEQRKELMMSDINKDIKNIQEVSEYYDEKRLERVLDCFYNKVYKEMDILWENYRASNPHPQMQEFEELDKLIYAELKDICKDTCVKFKEISWAAYKQVGRVDRDLLHTLREAGDKLISALKQTCEKFLNGVKEFFKESRGDVKQAAAVVKGLSGKAKEKMAAIHKSASMWVDERVNAINSKVANIRDNTIQRGLSVVEWAINGFEGIKDKLKGNMTKRDFNSLHKAEGFKSIDPNYSNVKSETTPFIKALGVRVDRDENDNVMNIIYTPRLNKDELQEVVSRCGEEVGGKLLTEWLEEPDVKVEISVTVPKEGVLPAMAFVSDRNGDMIGYAYIDLTDDETEQITQVARDIGARAVLIDEIADKIRGDVFNEQNAKDWVAPLKACSFNELSAISDTLNAMPSQAAREGWAMGYLAKTEATKDASNKREHKSHKNLVDVDR